MCVVTMTDEDMETAKVAVTSDDKGMRVVVTHKGETYIDQHYLYMMDYRPAGYGVTLFNRYWGGAQLGESTVSFSVQSSGYSFDAEVKGIEHTHPKIAAAILAHIMGEPADRITISDRTKNKWGQDETAKLQYVSSYVEENDETVQWA